MRVAERFRWVSRVSDFRGVKSWTEVELIDGVLRKDGEEAMALSDVQQLRYQWYGSSEAARSFNRHKASLILEGGERRLVLEGTLGDEVEGKPFWAALARVVEACAEACPELELTEVRDGRISSGIIALVLLLVFGVPLASAVFTSVFTVEGIGARDALSLLLWLFIMLFVVAFAYKALRSRPRIDSLGDLAGLLDGVVRRGSPAVDAIPSRVTAARLEAWQRSTTPPERQG